MSEASRVPVHYIKAGGVQVDREKRQMTREQKAALKEMRDTLRGAGWRGEDDAMPLDALAEGVATYLSARRASLVATRGAAVGFAIDDEILDLREQ